MSDYRNKLSALVVRWFPEFVRENGPEFVKFIEAWIAWMEEDEGIVDATFKALDHKDIDYTRDRFLEAFHREFMLSIPKDVLTDRRLLLKHILDFYRARGSQKSYRFLFRILYGEEIDFYYPGRDILRCSHAKWVITRSLVIEPIADDATILAARGMKVRGSSSTASAVVEVIEARMESRRIVYYFELSNVRGTFVANEVLQVDGVTLGKITSYAVDDGKYVGTDGFLSSNKYLQGPHYYQEYSYVIKSGQPITQYRDIAKKLVHPAGTALFGQIDLEIDMPELALQLLPGSDFRSIELLMETVPLVPTMIVSQGYGAADPVAYEFEATVDVEPQIAEPLIAYLVTLTGTVTTANITSPAAIAAEPVANYASWSAETFTDGSGYIGTGTNLQTIGIETGLVIYLDDGVEEIATVFGCDSETTMRTIFPRRTMTGATVRAEIAI